jgi:hypothetical protein
MFASMETILPKLDELHSKGSITTDESFTERETLTRYLPETLDAYLRLPPAFACVHALQDGKPAKRLLVEQLQFLDERLKIMARNAVEQDIQALEANGRFLQERFGRSDLLVPPTTQ